MTEVSADDSRRPHQLVAVRLRDNPESPGAEWLRTLFVLPSGDVLVAAGFFGMEFQECLLESQVKHIQCAMHEDHFYVPTQ